ncbi:MAG: TRAM domain-containing protein [Bacillota bacterium]|nr:TRAM domain-containing protein [Bacillota bacterium]
MKKFIRIILGFFGSFIGYEVVKLLGLATEFSGSIQEELDTFFTSTQFIGILLGFLFGFFILFYLLEKILQLLISFENFLKELSWRKIVVGILGLAAGLLLAILINFSFSGILKTSTVGKYIGLLVNLVFAYLGFSLFVYKEKDILKFLKQEDNPHNIFGSVISNKILDTSVIIDGRIADVAKSGFVEGTLIVPEFVLEELRHIADSSETLKRNRGRRGLDILKQMQKEPHVNIQILTQDFDDIQEVDSKLVKLAQIMDARIVTNDFNLNKVAELHGVRVLNINELANAVKPIVLPGEEMNVKVIKEGKEDGQGVAYLDDGTMIVVDDGINFMNQRVSVLVTSILQTAAGRMIFAKPNAKKQIV